MTIGIMSTLQKFKLIFSQIACAAFSIHAYSQPAIPVDPLTGKVQLSIPIWNHQYRALSCPIQIAYSGGGVKVEASEGSAGAGWNLIAGGEVTRDVRGLPDDYSSTNVGDQRKGWLIGTNAQTIGNFAPTSETDAWNTLGNTLKYNVDPEPDIFFFSAPGLSGQFAFDNAGHIQTMPYQDVKIDVTKTGNTITAFTITNNLGVKYLFNGTVSKTRLAYSKTGYTYFKSDYYFYIGGIAYNDTWSLSAIIAPTSETLTFGYTGNPILSTSYDYIRKVNSSNTIDTLYVVKETSYPNQLTSITGGIFSTSLAWGGNLISEIAVTEATYGQVKKFTFVYGNAWNASDPYAGMDNLSTAFLKEVKELQNCTTFPSQSFDYYDVDFTTNTTGFPVKNKSAQDYWGYFNGKATTLVPTVYYNLDASSPGEVYRIVNASGYATLSGSDRTVDPVKVYSASLKRVTYPSGGYGEITYEAADYYDALTNSNQSGGGARVKSIKMSDGDANTTNDIVRNYDYKKTDNSTSSGKFIYRPVFTFAGGGSASTRTVTARTPVNQAPESGLMYDRVTVSVSGQGKTVYEFLLPAMFGETTNGDWLASYSDYARFSMSYGTGNYEKGYFLYPFPPNANYNFERGLTSRVSDYTQTGAITSSKRYSYQRVTPGQVDIKALRMEQYDDNTFVYAPYKLITQTGKAILRDSTFVFDQGSTNKVLTVTTSTFSSVHQLLATVTQANSDGRTYQTKYKYPKDYVITAPSGTDATMIKGLQPANMHGTVVEQIQSIDNTVTDASLTLFNSFPMATGTCILPQQQLKLANASGFQESSVASNAFNYFTSGYTPVLYFDTYDNLGNPVNTHDRQRNKKGIHWSHSQSLPVLTANQASAEEIVYNDFESYTPYQFNSQTNILSTDGRSGTHCQSAIGGVNYDKAGVTKGVGSFYRFSCWAKGSSNSTITFQVLNGASVVSSGAVSYSANTGWKYLEGRVSVASAPATFTFRVTPSVNVLLDDIAFYPELASISTAAYEPMNGKTCATDSKGTGVYYSYDALGRLQNSFNQDKDLVSIKEYQYQKSNNQPLPVSAFTSNVFYSDVTTSTPVTFTPNGSCMTGIVYSWSIVKARDGTVVASGTGPTMTYTFSENRDYVVRLVASQPAYGSSFSEVEINPVLAPLTFTVERGSGESQYISCVTSPTRTFTVTGLSLGFPGCGTLQYKWYYQASSFSYCALGADGWCPVVIGGLISTANNGVTLVFNITGLFPAQTYIIKCVVSTNCTEYDTSYTGLEAVSGQNFAFITLDPSNPPCP